MVYGAAAGETAGENPSVLFQLFHIAFMPAVLVSANNHGMPVLPEEEDDFPLLHMVHEIFFHCKIAEGILGILPVFKKCQFPNHGALQNHTEHGDGGLPSLHRACRWGWYEARCEGIQGPSFPFQRPG